MSATKAHRPSGVTTTPNGLPGTWTMAVRTPFSRAESAVEVPQPGEGSARVGKTSVDGAVPLRAWLGCGCGCGCAGLAEQPAQPMTATMTVPTVIAAATRMRMRIAGMLRRKKLISWANRTSGAHAVSRGCQPRPFGVKMT